jgi:hypothetical protein
MTEWCDCGRPHQSYCIEEDCRWGAVWPRPEEPLPSMESIPWLTEAQALRRTVYARRREAALPP